MEVSSKFVGANFGGLIVASVVANLLGKFFFLVNEHIAIHGVSQRNPTGEKA